MHLIGNSLEVQWLGLGAFTAGALGLIPGQGTKIPQAVQRGQNNNKFTLDKLGSMERKVASMARYHLLTGK